MNLNMTTASVDNWIRRFTITDPFKHSKGFTLYKITSLVYPRKYPEAVTKIVIWKRYNDFKKLHKELKVCHKKLQFVDEFPPFVKAKFFKRFETEVIEERRQAALQLLEYVARHPLLFTSDVFVKFFESGYTVDSEDGSTSTLPPSGIRPDPDTGQLPNPGSSDDDHTSFTTDTDSAISSPLQETIQQCESPHDLSIDEETWSSRQLQPSQSQTTLSSLTSVESLFSRRLQSFKNRFMSSSTDSADQARQREAEMARYWTEAQKVVTTAEQKEKEGDYQTAFTCYKSAIAQLLSGVQNDTDNDRRTLVKEKTADYLCKAEFIANNFLSSDSESVKKTESDVVPLSRLWQPLSDLQSYKVVGVIGKVMLVIDSRTNYLFIVKAMYKSAYPIKKNKCCIFPRRIPYMVELNAIFETDSSVFLILQYISGGKLWDYVGPFLQKLQETPAKSRRHSNQYSGLHCLEPDRVSISTSDSCPSNLNLPAADCEVRSTLSSPGNSYLDLIREYTSSKRVSLEPRPVSPNLPTTSAEHALYKIVSDTLNTDTADSQDQNNTLPTLTGSCDNLYRDVLTLVNSEFTLNIEDSVDVETKDLVEHAQRLLQSVDATLLESESVISRVAADDRSLSETDDRQVIRADDRQLMRLAVEAEADRLSVASNHSNRSLDVNRLLPNISSKGSSPLSSIGPDGARQWCQLETSGAGIVEDTVRLWAAQLLVAVNALHQMGIICLDLNPDNVLVCGTTIRLTYFCSFPGVEPQLSWQARSQLFTAPEMASIFPVTPAADWWSLGTLLFHLLTGQSLSSYYPSGIFCHTILHIPDTISIEARSLLRELLKYNPNERLGSGLLGVEEIKSHPFFEGVQWDQVYNEGLLPV